MPCVRRKYEKHSRNFMEARAALSNEPSEVDRERVGRYYHLMRNQVNLISLCASPQCGGSSLLHQNHSLHLSFLFFFALP